MRIGFFCERGEIPEIGTGHYYRSKWTSEEMALRGHDTINISPDDDLPGDIDILVIDDLRSQKPVMDDAIKRNIKTVLIDGVPGDIANADLTISACFNEKAQYKGVKYMSFLPRGDKQYSVDQPDNIFVSMGGFDANQNAKKALVAINELGLNAIVTKSINHFGFAEVFPNVEVFVGEDYYIPMSKCKVGVVNGGLTMFQAMHFGLPVLAVPQYDHQREYIKAVSGGCWKTNVKDIKNNLVRLLQSAKIRKSLSTNGQRLVDGKAIGRTCDLIEGIMDE